MARSPCCDKMGLKKGPWTPEEDKILVAHVQKHGHGNWRALPKQAGNPLKPICYFSYVSVSLQHEDTHHNSPL